MQSHEIFLPIRFSLVLYSKSIGAGKAWCP